MKLFLTLAFSLWLVGSASAAPAPPAARPELSAGLIHLAARAKTSRTWPELRRYAKSRKSAQERAVAYFVLGYREYQAGEYAAAQKDLGIPSAIPFPLEDLAQYYCASAAYKAGHPEDVVRLLASFSVRFPSSAVHFDALELEAWGYLQTGQPERALKVLQAEPQVRQRPALALLLGQAYMDAGKLKSAARTYQEVYNAFPTTSQAKAAGDVLEKLKRRQGVSFPPVSDEIATARVEKLYAARRYALALKGYNALLKDRQGSSWSWRWNLGRAECLIRQGQANNAIETLVNSVAPTPELDAQRLAILVEAYIKTGGDTAAAQSVNQLRSNHLHSHWHAMALEDLANHFMYQGDRRLAGSYYRTLALLFPQTPQGHKASWRLAWINYLDGDPADAQKLFLEHIKNYPQSAHVPAALYYLGRLEEKKHPSTARALYSLIRKRYVHGYYALEAGRRLRSLPRQTASAADSNAGFSIAELAAKIPPADPPGAGLCQRIAAGKSLQSFQMLEAVHLDTLAERDLKAQLAREPSSIPLLLTFSRFASRQDQPDRALHNTKKIVPDYDSQPFSELPREIWELLYPRAYERSVRRHAAVNHLDPYLVMALIRQESAFNPRATSPSNARGLMQILPSTITRSRRYQRTVARRLYTPAYNMRYGCDYMRKLLKRFDGSLPEALAAYNAGPTNVSQWLSAQSYRSPEEFVESIPFPGTRIYVKAVLRDQAIYHQLMRGTAQFAECPLRSGTARDRTSGRHPRRSRSRAGRLSAAAAASASR